jgi:anti-sigma-K factor RskA
LNYEKTYNNNNLTPEAIISSGLLELHATGLTSSGEAILVEQMIEQYPEVAMEFALIESSLEQYALSTAIQPSAAIKQKIFNQINNANTNQVEVEKLQLSTYRTNKKAKIEPIWKLAAAVIVLLLASSLLMNIILYTRKNDVVNQLAQTQAILSDAESKNSENEHFKSIVQNKYSLPVRLSGLEASPDAVAKVFWMKNTGEVYIDPSSLPEVPTGMQYQLWAFVDGKPVDAGMILNTKKGKKYSIQKMKSFGRAEAFAVTLEHATDKPNPTPNGPVYVLGKLQ